MGRASRWVMNLLLGKKEKGKDTSLSEMSAGTSVAIVPRTPIYKRRWSFGRTAVRERAHKSSRSLDLSTTKTVVLQTEADSENQQNNMTVVAATSVSVMPTKHASNGINVRVEDAAATKIQAAFRTYLVLIQTYILLQNHIIGTSENDQTIYAGKESTLCAEESSQVTSTGKRSPGEEENNYDYSLHARTNVDTSQSSISKNPDG